MMNIFFEILRMEKIKYGDDFDKWNCILGFKVFNWPYIFLWNGVDCIRHILWHVYVVALIWKVLFSSSLFSVFIFHFHFYPFFSFVFFFLFFFVFIYQRFHVDFPVGWYVDLSMSFNQTQQFVFLLITRYENRKGGTNSSSSIWKLMLKKLS